MPRFTYPEDTAIILQTSGTTSIPKIMPLTEKQICNAVTGIFSLFNPVDQDKSLHIVPHFHLLGIIGTCLVPLLRGGTVICTRDFITRIFFFF